MRMTRWCAAFCALVLLAACGGDAEREPDAMDMQPQLTPGAGDVPPVVAEEDIESVQIDVTLTEWELTLSQDSVPAGAVTFNIRNAGTVPHAFRVFRGDEEWETDPYDPGERVSMSVNLTPGTYEVHCPLNEGGVSHTQQGMQRRLRVY